MLTRSLTALGARRGIAPRSPACAPVSRPRQLAAAAHRCCMAPTTVQTGRQPRRWTGGSARGDQTTDTKYTHAAVVAPTAIRSAILPPSPQLHLALRSFSSGARPPSSSSSTATSSSSTSSTVATPSQQQQQSWWDRWTHEHPMPPRGTTAWYLEMALICTVFAITGSSSMYFVKPLVKDVIGIDGTFMDGPWSYRLVCIAVLMPCYSIMLVTFGTVFRRHHYFKRQALKMWGRILPLHKIGIVAKPAPVAPTTAATAAIKQSKP